MIGHWAAGAARRIGAALCRPGTALVVPLLLVPLPLTPVLLGGSVPGSSRGAPAVPAAGWSAQVAPPRSTLATVNLADWLPSAVTATRVSPVRCRVDWTQDPSAATGITYDITDGKGTTLADHVSGDTATVTVPPTAITPRVYSRFGSWLSGTAASSTSCAPAILTPATPVVAVTVGDGRAPADRGSRPRPGRPKPPGP